MNEKSILGITGTTSVGKSAVAVEIALALGCDIISADSMQIYKGMDVGTAKITESEKKGVTHHMIDVVEPCEDFSSFLYQEKVGEILQNAYCPPVICGGTGFYFDSLRFPPEFNAGSGTTREVLKQRLENEGLESLTVELLRLDPTTYSKIDLQNPVRVMRALEIALSGQSQSSGTNKDKKPLRDICLFVLERDRNDLYDKINERVDQMIADGLVDEAQKLYEKYGRLQNSAFSAIGYKELYDYFEGKITFEQAVEQIKTNTRHYAKRQISYFKRMDVYEFVDVTKFDSIKDLANYIVKRFKEYKNTRL